MFSSVCRLAVCMWEVSWFSYAMSSAKLCMSLAFLTPSNNYISLAWRFRVPLLLLANNRTPADAFSRNNMAVTAIAGALAKHGFIASPLCAVLLCRCCVPLLFNADACCAIVSDAPSLRFALPPYCWRGMRREHACCALAFSLANKQYRHKR